MWVETSIREIVDKYTSMPEELIKKWTDPLLDVYGEIIKKEKKERPYNLSKKSLDILANAIPEILGNKFWELILNRKIKRSQDEGVDIKYIKTTIEYILSYGKNSFVVWSINLERIVKEILNEVANIVDEERRKGNNNLCNYYAQFFSQVYDALVEEYTKKLDNMEFDKLEELVIYLCY